MSCDNFYDQTVLTMHMEGSNAGTTFVDTSPIGLTSNSSPFGATHLQPIFGAQTSTAEFLFGTSSYTGGVGGGAVRVINNNIISALDSLYDITGDFTVEGAIWLAAPDVSFSGPILSISNFTNLAQIFLEIGITVGTGLAYGIARTQAGATVASLIGVTVCADGTWHRIAFQRTGNLFQLFVDGTEEANTTSSGVIGTTYGDIAMGRTAGNGGSVLDSGFLDEIRMTLAARYTGTSYTLDSDAFPDSQCTGPPPPPPGTIFAYGKFVPAGQFKAIELDRLGTIKPHVYAPVPNRIVRT